MGENKLFSAQELQKMIVPMFLEQLLVMLVGLADTLIVSYAGESAASNVLNVIGNVIGVFLLRAGVAGVAWLSFISRVFSAVVITELCFRKRNGVVYRGKWIFGWNGSLMKSILNVAVPNGIENGIFQLVKVALSSIVAMFGTYQIAANGVAQSIWSLAAWNFLIFILTPVFLRFSSLSPETKQLVIWLVLIHNVFNAAVYPFSGAFNNGLRAAGDVKFTMYVSVVSTVAVRLFLSYLLGITLHMGVIGIALAMVCDWVVRAVLFIRRERTGRWRAFQVIR